MTYTKGQLSVLVLLRIAIGWHFLFEGASKLLSPSWTSKAYLLDSRGIFSGFFEWIASNDSALLISDAMNAWGLALIGLGLVIGLFTRISILAGILLLFLYYLSHPACLGFEYIFPMEGNYFIINKNILELLALVVLFFFPTGHIIGIDRFLRKRV